MRQLRPFTDDNKAYIATKTSNDVYSGADPGFSRRGAPTYYLPKFRRKLHGNEENSTRVTRPKFYYVDPPLLSRLNITIIFLGQDLTAENEQKTKANEAS